MSRPTIVAIDYDPPGADVQGEHVVVRNTGDTALDLSGWTLRDTAPVNPHIFHFNGIVVPPRGEVRVWTKPGTNSATDLFWNLNAAVWNNTGDTAILRDASGAEADRLAYLPAPSDAQTLKLAVPAFWGLPPAHPNEWLGLQRAGAAAAVTVLDGSLPDYVSKNPDRKADVLAFVDGLEGTVLGYVPTRTSTKSLLPTEQILHGVTPPEGEPTGVTVDDWYAHLGGHVDGIYFDELVLPDYAPGVAEELAVVHAFKAEHPAAKVMILAGQCHDEAVVGPQVDWALLWETELPAYLENFLPDGGPLNLPVPAWWKNPAYRGKIAHVVHNVPEPERQRVLGLALERNAGLVFVMDRRGVNGKGEYVLYDHLPPYWDHEVREINSYFDFGFEPRHVLLAARRYGLAAGRPHAWPNFEAVWYGNTHVRGTYLLTAGAAGVHVLEAAQTALPVPPPRYDGEPAQVPRPYDLAAWWRAAHDYARARGYETAIPTFEPLTSGGVPVCRMIAFDRNLPWLEARTVSVDATYQRPTFAEPGAVVRNVNRALWGTTAADGKKFVAAFPTFVPDPKDTYRGRKEVYFGYGLKEGAPVEWRDVPTSEYLDQL